MAKGGSSSWRLQSSVDIREASCPEKDEVSQLKPWRVVNDAADGASGRSFLVYLPPQLCTTLLQRPEEQQPNNTNINRLRVILAIHGYGGRPLQEIRKWHEAAVALNAIILAPEGSYTEATQRLGWNANDCCGDPVTKGVDDVDFVTKGAVDVFLDALQSVGGGMNDGVPKGSAVIATGFSNGGFLTSLLGLLPAEKRPSWLVGAAPMGGYQYDVALYSGPGPDPLPLMMHHAGRDVVVRPNGCCAAEDATESNCVLDIGIKQQTCTSVETAFELWHRINGCASADVAEETEYANPRLGYRKGTEPKNSTVTCRKGGGCTESTVYCLWHAEGHAWGYQFPGSEMTRKWMEGVFRQAEEKTQTAVFHRRSDGGRRSFVASTIALLVLFAMAVVFKKTQLMCCRGRKRKTSEETLSSESENDHIALTTLVASGLT